MNIAGLRSALYELTREYFVGAKVAFGNTNITKPGLPFVLLTMGTLQRPSKPEIRFRDGRVVQIYPCTIRLVVNLYTKGILNSSFGADYYEDTAQSDLAAFVNFIDSDKGIEICNKYDIYVALVSGPDDVTALENDAFFEYRARAEFMVGFTEVVVGKAGQLSLDPPQIIPNGSGGGSEAIATEETGYFTDAELIYVNDPVDDPEGEDEKE